jgi:hypothetical protein
MHTIILALAVKKPIIALLIENGFLKIFHEII